MQLIKAQEKDFERVCDLYTRIIGETTGMEQYARWKKGLYPTEEIDPNMLALLGLTEADVVQSGSYHQTFQAFDSYGVDAVMVGRATFGCPWFFSREQLTLDQKIDVLLEQLHINVERLDEYRGILHTRRHLAATPIFKGIPDFRQTRIAMLRAETVADLTAIIEQVRERLHSI